MTVKTTIVMRSFNDGPRIVEQTLEALSRQEGVEWTLIHIDNSTDGTQQVLQEKGGTFYHINAGEYIPGRVINLGMRLCEDEWVTFLNADATPVGRDWLSRLLAPLVEDEEVVASFSQQIPRDDALPLFRKDYQRAFGDGRGHAAWPHFFSMAASAIRRSWWERDPFHDAITSTEDGEWTYRARLQGKRIVYVPDSIAVHSHNYTFRQSLKRHRAEGSAIPWMFHLKAGQAGFLRQALLPAAMEVVRDIAFAVDEKEPRAIWQSPGLRVAQGLGRWLGVRDGLKDSLAAAYRPAPDVAMPTRGKYTVDPLPELEARLDRDMARLAERFAALPEPPKALVLGGGYGRREGGAWKVDGHWQPYNDYDLYALYEDAPPWKMSKIRHAIEAMAEEATAEMGLDVDVAVVCERKLRNAPPRIEWYELRRGNRVLIGSGRAMDILPDVRGSEIPSDEGERLLMNRAIGMIYARRHLDAFRTTNDSLPLDDLDFITRNIYKALLAGGDVVLLRLGLYHYSYRERLARLEALELESPLRFDDIKAAYRAAMQYRFYPAFENTTYAQLEAFWTQARDLFHEAHRWFIQVTRGASTWEDYGEKLLSPHVRSAQVVVNAVQNRRRLGRWPSDGQDLRRYLAHPQYRVRAAVPEFLYHLDITGNGAFNGAAETLAGLLAAPPDERAPQQLEERLLHLWKEVN